MASEKVSYGDLFLKLAGVDEDGFSRKVSVDEFVGRYSRLQFGNGGSWARKDGPLGKKYNVVRHKEGKGNKITHVELQGFNKTPKHAQISQSMREYYKGADCVVLAVSKVQIDHKDGRYDDPKVADISQQKLEDFQPLSEAVNYAKRQHCKECSETGNRFDATRLGYPVAQVKGNGKYRGTCKGCYWYDPREFNASMTFKS